MTIIRFITVLFVLLFQAMPAKAMLRVTKIEKCQMSCCASLDHSEMIGCGCSHAPVEPTQAPQGHGRELVKQVVWSVSHESGLGPRAMAPTVVITSRLLEANPPVQSHVRLSVLFCSYLN